MNAGTCGVDRSTEAGYRFAHPGYAKKIMPSSHPKRVFFFLSGGWGPLVRTLPIARRLADHGIGSSLAIGGAVGGKLRAAGCDLIEFTLPAFNASADTARGWWS